MLKKILTCSIIREMIVIAVIREMIVIAAVEKMTKDYHWIGAEENIDMFDNS